MALRGDSPTLSYAAFQQYRRYWPYLEATLISCFRKCEAASIIVLRRTMCGSMSESLRRGLGNAHLRLLLINRTAADRNEPDGDEGEQRDHHNA